MFQNSVMYSCYKDLYWRFWLPGADSNVPLWDMIEECGHCSTVLCPLSSTQSVLYSPTPGREDYFLHLHEAGTPQSMYLRSWDIRMWQYWEHTLVLNCCQVCVVSPLQWQMLLWRVLWLWHIFQGPYFLFGKKHFFCENWIISSATWPHNMNNKKTSFT